MTLLYPGPYAAQKRAVSGNGQNGGRGGANYIAQYGAQGSSYLGGQEYNGVRDNGNRGYQSAPGQEYQSAYG